MDNIYIRFGTKLYRQIVGIPMGTNCAPLVADLFLFCYERDFMKDLSSDNQADVIKAFNSTSRYLDDLLNIDNPYFEGMVNQRTTCIIQGFWPPLKPKIKSVFTTLSLDCFIRRMTQVFISHIDLTLPVAMVTENGRQNRLK